MADEKIEANAEDCDLPRPPLLWGITTYKQPKMATDFTSIVRGQLGEFPPSSRAERDIIYEQIHGTLNRMFAGRESTAEHFSASIALQKAINEIEARFVGANSHPAVPRDRARLHGDDKTETTVKAKVRPKGKRGSSFWRIVDRINQIWSTAKKLGQAVAVLVVAFAIASIVYWYFWSEERELPTVQRSAIEQTACKPILKEQCDFLISAIERTKNRGVIVAANAGNLKPADDAIQANAKAIEANPKASAESKRQAAADVAVLGLALSRVESQTKRVGDLIEDGARRELQAREEAERQQRSARESELQGTRRKILESGYSLDATGYFEAMADNFSYTIEYKKLNIEPTEDALRAVLQKIKNPARGQLINSLAYVPIDYPYAKKLSPKLIWKEKGS